MAARELSRNCATRYALFFIDSFSADGSKLPTSEKSGTDELYLSTPVAFGSIAKSADGKQYILTGENTWTAYSGSSAGGGGSFGGGGDSGGISDADIATEQEVDNMLQDVFA